MRLYLYVARKAVATLLASLAGIVVVFLAIDVADNPWALEGARLGAVLALYANKATIVAYQTAPVAILLAAGLTASALRATREYTAMRALGFGPWRVAVPVLAVSLVASTALLASSDDLVVLAGRRLDRVLAQRFQRGSAAARMGGEAQRWFRSRDGRRVYHLRGNLEGGGFERMTLYEIGAGFQVARRIDGERMLPGPSGEWTVEEVTERLFDGDHQTDLKRYARRTYQFDEAAEAFALAPGRPAQLTLRRLAQQARLRRALGLASNDYALALQNRFAYPLAGVPAALVAVALALRRNRRWHVSATLLEAVCVSLAFWALQGVFGSFALTGRLPAGWAAWTPNALFLAVGALLLARRG